MDKRAAIQLNLRSSCLLNFIAHHAPIQNVENRYMFSFSFLPCAFFSTMYLYLYIFFTKLFYYESLFLLLKGREKEKILYMRCLFIVSYIIPVPSSCGGSAANVLIAFSVYFFPALKRWKMDEEVGKKSSLSEAIRPITDTECREARCVILYIYLVQFLFYLFF